MAKSGDDVVDAGIARSQRSYLVQIVREGIRAECAPGGHLFWLLRNSDIRARNRQVASAGGLLKPLLTPECVAPPGFPATSAALEEMTSPAIAALLKAYGLAVPALYPARKQALRTFVGTG